MAKLPKIGGVRPDDPVYKELLQGLQKREQAMKSAAEAQQKAAEEQLVAADKIETAAQDLTEAADNLSKATEKNGTAGIAEQLSQHLGLIQKSIGSVTNTVGTTATQDSDVQAQKKQGGGKQNVFTELLDVNKEILNATLSNKDVLLKILDFFSRQETKKLSPADYKDEKAKIGTGAGERSVRGGSSQLGNLTKLLTVAAGVIVGIVAGQLRAIKTMLTVVFNTFKTAINLVKNIFSMIGEGAAFLGNILKSKFPEFFKSIEDGIASVKGFIGKSVTGLTESIAGIFKSLKSLVLENSVVTKITGFVKGMFQLLETKLVPIIEFLSEGFKTIFGSLSKTGTTVTTLAKDIESIIMPIFESFKGAASAVGEIGGIVARWFKPIGQIARYFGSIASLFGPIVRIVGKIFAPIAIIMTLWDTVKGAIEGYQEEGIIGGIKGAIKGLFDSLIFGPLDLVKDATAWVLKQFGFENAAEALDSFKFSELFDKYVDGVFEAMLHPIDSIVKLFHKVFDDLPETLIKLLPEDWQPTLRSILGMQTPEERAAAEQEAGRYEDVQVEVPTYDPVTGAQTGTTYETQRRLRATENGSGVAVAQQSAQQAAANASPPVIVNNNNVNNNNYAGGAGASADKVGGAILTTPPQSHIDRSMYGWADLHSATP